MRKIHLFYRKNAKFFGLYHSVAGVCFSASRRRLISIISASISSFFARVAQERRRMIYGANGKGAALKPYTVLGGDAEIRLYQPHCRYSAEADDELRRNGANLLAQVLYAEILLLRLRVAVFGRAALQHICYVDFLARDADGYEIFIKKLARRTDKRNTR